MNKYHRRCPEKGQNREKRIQEGNIAHNTSKMKIKQQECMMELGETIFMTENFIQQ